MENNLDLLLAKWEGVYKKGLLSFWILLLIDERPAYAYEMADEIQRISQGTVSVDEKSLYRALSRFENAEILDSELRKSDIGPSRRYYSLSDLGKELLVRFIERNLVVFNAPEIQLRIKGLLNERPDHERKLTRKNSDPVI
jgi:DNA-binding PadR family transcriptional regulator